VGDQSAVSPGFGEGGGRRELTAASTFGSFPLRAIKQVDAEGAEDLEGMSDGLA
jgi:hypothetical protein